MDRGLTWDTLGFRHSNVFQVAIDPLHPQTIWIANGATGLWQSTDGGLNWTNRSAGLDLGGGFGVAEIVICPADPTQLICAANNPEAPSRGYASFNGGASWEIIEELQPYGPGIFRYDAVATGVVYCFTGGDGRFARAEQCGPPFNRFDLPFIEGANDLMATPDQAGKLFWATRRHSVWMSTDSGTTWTARMTRFMGTDSSVLALEPIGGGNTLLLATRVGAAIVFDSDSIVMITAGFEPLLPPSFLVSLDNSILSEFWAGTDQDGIWSYTYVDSNTGISDRPIVRDPLPLQVFPNPSMGYIEIKFPTVTGFTEIQVCDLLGRILFSQHFPMISSEVMLSLPTSLPTGSYFLYMHTSRNKTSKEFAGTKILIIK
jgi:hypothetical protein